MRRASAGFSLVEVIIALVMVGVIVTVLLTTEGYTVRAAARAKREVVVTMALKERLAAVDMHLFSSSSASGEEPLPDYCPVGTMTYESRRPTQGSVLGKLDGIRIDTVRAIWYDGTVPITQELVRYVYAPESRSSKTE